MSRRDMQDRYNDDYADMWDSVNSQTKATRAAAASEIADYKPAHSAAIQRPLKDQPWHNLVRLQKSYAKLVSQGIAVPTRSIQAIDQEIAIREKEFGPWSPKEE